MSYSIEINRGKYKLITAENYLRSQKHKNGELKIEYLNDEIL
jgi:hypothetical protein